MYNHIHITYKYNVYTWNQRDSAKIKGSNHTFFYIFGIDFFMFTTIYSYDTQIFNLQMYVSIDLNKVIFVLYFMLFTWGVCSGFQNSICSQCAQGMQVQLRDLQGSWGSFMYTMYERNNFPNCPVNLLATPTYPHQFGLEKKKIPKKSVSAMSTGCTSGACQSRIPQLVPGF